MQEDALSNQDDVEAQKMGTAGFLTRGEVAKRLGVTVSEVRRREALGKIKPTGRSPHGWVLYSEQDLIGQPLGKDVKKRVVRGTEKAPRPVLNAKFTSEEALQVYRLLRHGKNLIDAVMDTGLHPEVVESIAESYSKMSGGIFLTKAQMEQIEAMPLEGTFPLQGGDELVQVIRDACSETCKACAKRARAYCKVCLQQFRNAGDGL